MKTLISLAIVASLVMAGCGSEPSESADPVATGPSAAQLKHGIGPIAAFSVDEVDPELAALGESVFTMKCSACHKMNQRYVGPALAGVTESRSPAFLMNMMLNPEGMIAEHPEVRALLAEYMTPMPNQHLSEDEARAVLEFLRTQSPQ